jgi:hypothetical protein
MAMADNPVYLVSVLIEELKIELMQGRLNSIREELDVAKALGGERARKEQIRLLSDYIDAEDERLLAMARASISPPDATPYPPFD